MFNQDTWSNDTVDDPSASLPSVVLRLPAFDPFNLSASLPFVDLRLPAFDLFSLSASLPVC